MSDEKLQGNEEDFASLFENSISGMDSMEPGQMIETEIVTISGDSIFLQLSGKSEGILDKAEMEDKEGNLTVKEGDTIQVYFLKSKNGEMHFTTRISSSEAGQAVLENAYSNGIPVEGVVEKEIKGGFEVKIGEARAFCPYSQMGERRVENASEYVGKHLSFKIIEHSENGRNILVSNRAIIEEERQKQMDELKKVIKVGQTVTGTVLQIRDFGAFVDIGGIQALLPVSEISRTRVDNVNQVLEIGQEVEASILKLDWQNERFSISMKALEKDPWDTAAETYKAGSTHKGKVARIMNFGAFVTLEPGMDGLIHISDMKFEDRDHNPADLYESGEEVEVIVNSVDLEKKRISLKPASSFKKDAAAKKYMDSETETYNPFAALLKDRVEKKK
ncbi:MAG: 30S ribosomal protein S1 [Spirochaetales bacterium]|nr:30S ribosomal protein S1 [Spirochaetales bacterium]